MVDVGPAGFEQGVDGGRRGFQAAVRNKAPNTASSVSRAATGPARPPGALFDRAHPRYDPSSRVAAWRARRAALTRAPQPRELTLGTIQLAVQPAGGDQPEDCVAEELESLIVRLVPLLVGEGAVGERLGEERRLPENLAERRLEEQRCSLNYGASAARAQVCIRRMRRTWRFCAS